MQNAAVATTLTFPAPVPGPAGLLAATSSHVETWVRETWASVDQGYCDGFDFGPTRVEDVLVSEDEGAEVSVVTFAELVFHR